MFLLRIRAAALMLFLSAGLAGCATGHAYVGAEAGPMTLNETGAGSASSG